MSSKDIVTVLTALTLWGCASATGPDHGLDVSIVPSSGVVHSGGFIDLKVTVTNRGTSVETVRPPACQGEHGVFVVTDPSGDVVGPGEMSCTLAERPPTRLAPGEELGFRSQWDGDSQRSALGGPRAYLEPGEYHVRGQVLAVSGRVLSAPVSIRVAK